MYRTKTNVALILAELNGAKSQFIQQKKSNFLLFIGFFVRSFVPGSLPDKKWKVEMR